MTCKDKAKGLCKWEWVVCAGGANPFNIYRCKTCGLEDWT